MGSDPADPYAPRQDQMAALFTGLRTAGTDDYWDRIEQTAPAGALPLEVLAMCVRERLEAGHAEDAARIFAAMALQLERNMTAWAKKAARLPDGTFRADLLDDLVQEGFLDLWANLTAPGDTFLTVNFWHGLMRTQQHAAHRFMEQQGLWQRKGVDKPNRVPAQRIDSIEAGQRTDDGETAPYPLPDTQASDALEQVVDREDLAEAIRALDQEYRDIIYQAFVEGLTQDDIARLHGITSRTVRARLARIYALLRQALSGE